MCIRDSDYACGSGLLEAIQQPGETLWVPQGWRHAVYNLGELSVAVTHNLLPWAAMPRQLSSLSTAYPALTRYLFALALRNRPEIANAMTAAGPIPTRPTGDDADDSDDDGAVETGFKSAFAPSAGARAFAARGMSAEFYHLAAAGMYADFWRAAARL